MVYAVERSHPSIPMQYEADEMSTEVMENAANAASKRREQRRRRILMNPEERMKKLTGHSDISSGKFRTYDWTEVTRGR